MTHAESFFAAAAKICHDIPFAAIETLAAELDRLRERQGRLFLIGVGGSAGNCSHAVNDFRKLCGIEAYSPIDNVSELTARANDEGSRIAIAEERGDQQAAKEMRVFRKRLQAQSAPKSGAADG